MFSFLKRKEPQPSQPPADLPALLALEVHQGTFEDEKKAVLLARVFGCEVHELRRHPRMAALLKKIEELFAGWLDPQASAEVLRPLAERVALLHDRLGVPASALFEAMAQVQRLARAHGAPEVFFAQSSSFVQMVMEMQERLLEEKRQEASYWRMIFSEAPIGMVVYDVDGHYTNVNDVFCQMTGMRQEELLDPGFNWQTLFSECLDATFAVVNAVMETQQPHSAELIISGRGKRVEVLCTSVALPWEDDKGRPLQGAFHQDLSVVKAKEAALQEERNYAVALQEERDYAQELIASLPEGAGIFTPDGEFYDINEAFCQLVGFGKEELLQKGWKPITPAEHLETSQKYIAEALQGKLVRYERNFLHRDGRLIPTLISYRLLKRRKGWDKDRLIAAFVDLSSEKAKEALIQEEKTYFQGIFNGLAEGVAIFDAEGKFYGVNEAFHKMMGYTKEEILRMGWKPITPPEYIEGDLRHIAEALQGKVVRYEKAHIRKDGTAFPVLVSSRLLPRRKGWDKDRLLKTCIDLTQEKAMEAKLKEERAFWNSIFNGAPSSMFLTGMDGKLVDANEACAREHGFDPEELQALFRKGVNAIDLFVSRERCQELKSLLADVVTGELAVYEFEDIRKDGTPLPVLAMIQKIERQGQPLYLIAQVSLLEIKQKEAELQETLLRLSDAGRLLESFAGELFSSQQVLSQRIEKEASSLEEISASMEEITATSQAVADQGIRTLEAVQAVDEAAQGISAKMTSLKVQMDELSETSQDTTEIISSIGRIAMQTQLLSLNASIEAAKARGEASKGFAVIAGEIHKLANRTESNVKDTEKWFKKLDAQIRQSLAAAGDALLKLEDIATQTSVVREMTSQVTAAIEENQTSSRLIQASVNDLELGLQQLSIMGGEVLRVGEKIRDESHNLVMAALQARDVSVTSAEDTIASALNNAISNHHQWRSRLLDAAHGHEAVDPLQVGDSKRCAFGHFLDENADIKRLPQYNEILRLHKNFHDEARRIANLILEGKKREAQHELLLGNSAYNRMSQGMVRSLEELLRKAAMDERSLDHAKV